MTNTKTEEVIAQAISDLDDIETAIEEMGVDVPYDTDTKEYGNIIRDMVQSKTAEAYDEGYAKGAEENQAINPEWTDWQYFSTSNNRNDLVAKLKYDDTSNGTTFDNMYYKSSELTEVPRINTSKGTSFKYMFYNCEKLTTIPEFDTSNATTVTNMFYGCTLLEMFPPLDVRNCTTLDYVFRNTTNAKSISLRNTSNITSLQYTFSGSGISEIPEMDMSNVTNFNYAFAQTKNLTTISELDTSNGTKFNYMFQSSSIVELPVLNTAKGTNFEYMFGTCYSLETIGGIDFSSAKPSGISQVFYHANKLKNVTFNGVINLTANLSIFGTCYVITVDSIMSAINALSDNSSLSTTYTFTIGSKNLANLTEEQKAIATAKNIKLA